MIRSKHAALAVLLAASPAATALQTVTARDGETVFARIAQKEITRIAFDAGRIRKVTGNVGEFVLEKDEDKGEIFVRPADPSATKPINLFVASERSTVGLLLQPVDAPSDTIVIRERQDATARSSPPATASRHIRVLKNTLLALATDAMPDDMQRRESTIELALRPGLRMTLQRSHLGSAIVGETYFVTNLSASPIRLEARDLYKSGVMAVSIENEAIAPAASVSVFVIRERRPHE